MTERAGERAPAGSMREAEGVAACGAGRRTLPSDIFWLPEEAPETDPARAKTAPKIRR